MSLLARGKASRRHPGQERGLGGRGGGRRGERPAWWGNRGQDRTLRLQRPQRAAVEHGGFGELAVAETLVAGGAERLHGVCELGAHPRGRAGAPGGASVTALRRAQQRPGGSTRRRRCDSDRQPAREGAGRAGRGQSCARQGPSCACSSRDLPSGTLCMVPVRRMRA